MLPGGSVQGEGVFVLRPAYACTRKLPERGSYSRRGDRRGFVWKPVALCMHTKFEVSSLSRFGDTRGSKNQKVDHVTLPRPPYELLLYIFPYVTETWELPQTESQTDRTTNITTALHIASACIGKRRHKNSYEHDKSLTWFSDGRLEHGAVWWMRTDRDRRICIGLRQSEQHSLSLPRGTAIETPYL